MRRRNYLKTAGIAAGVFGSGLTDSASAESAETTDSKTRNSRQVTIVNDLLALSEDELWELPNDEVKRPFDPQIGSGKAYDADEWAAPDGYPHGGTVTRDDADYVAGSREELQSALDMASKGDVVWIPGDATIDALGPKPDEKGSYYGRTPFVVPAGVTVASDRGQDGSEGAALVKERPDRAATFRVVGDGARVTGLRFIGPEREFWSYEERGIEGNVYDVGVSFGVWLEGPSDYSGDPVSGDTESLTDIEVDNCYFAGFIYNCVRVGGLSWIGSARATNTYLHHNDFVDTPSPSLGYGITVLKGETFAEFNYFDNNRHAVAGHGGASKSDYVLTNNLFGPRTRSHVIDCHGGELDGYDHPVAGKRLEITNNVVLATRNHDGPGTWTSGGSIVDIRGIPLEQAEISHNWFFSDEIPPMGDGSDSGESGDVIDQWAGDSGFENLWIYNNLMGKFNPLNAVGVDGRWKPETNFQE